jgi:hypothetical protein
MDKDAILGFIKKNMLSLSCAVVALVCVGLFFYPLGGMQDTLQQSATDRGNVYGSLNSLLKPGQRKLPVHDLDGTDPGQLPFFPNKPTIDKGHEANAKWKEYSDYTLKLMIEMNQSQHPKLMQTVLPDKTSDPDYLAFPEVYQKVLSSDPNMTGIGYKDAKPPIDPDNTLRYYKALNIQNDILHGGMPPSLADVDAAGKALYEGTYRQQLIEANGQVVNQAEVDGRWKADVAGLQLRMEKMDARKYRVYVDTDAFGPSTKMALGGRSMMDDIWYCQMQVWVDQDIARAVMEANAGASDVLDAPVKRLIRVDIKPNQTMYVMLPPANGSGQPGQPVVAAPASDTAPILPNYTVSVTGRYSNPMYDVVSFKVLMDVDATKVNQVLETLSKRTLMTVTEENMYTLSSEAESAKGYLYGRDPVVRLELRVDAPFFREWTKPWMPDAVKMQLGIMAPAAGFTPGQPGFAPGGGPPMGGRQNSYMPH